MTCNQASHQRITEMFEFAAGQVQQEERERRIADGLRRRQLLGPATITQDAHGQRTEAAAAEGRTQAHGRIATPARAHAER